MRHARSFAAANRLPLVDDAPCGALRPAKSSIAPTVPLSALAKAPAREYVQVQVKHRLARLRTVADYHAKGIFDAELTSDLSHGEHEVAEQRLVIRGRVGKARDLLLRDKQDMD